MFPRGPAHNYGIFFFRSEAGGVQSRRMLHGAVFADGHHLRGQTIPPVLRGVPFTAALEALQFVQGAS